MESDNLVPEDDKETQPAQPLAGVSPLEKLQRRYSDQLSQDIEQLEAQKAKLQSEVAALTNVYAVLEADVRSLQRSVNEVQQDEAQQDEARQDEAQQVAQPTGLQIAQEETEKDVRRDAKNSASVGPRLPGEPVTTAEPRFTEPSKSAEPIELPIPSTSEQLRQRRIQKRLERDALRTSPRRGIVLAAIATVLIALQFCIVSALSQGGSWLGVTIGQLGTGFMPATALLWLRMLVTVPALILLAPQLYADTWEDVQGWMYSRNHLLSLLISSGIALFFSQVLIYQCVGLLGSAIGAALLFLYPLVAIPLGAVIGKAQGRAPSLSALSGLALVAIAMGGILLIKPILGAHDEATTRALWLGMLAGVAFGLFILLTNLSYRQQQCHSIPVGLVQFSTVAVLSSVVLLAKPITPISISWSSFAIWGLLVGFFMLLVYLLNYASLRLIGARTAIVAAAVPLVTLLLSWSFMPRPSLALVQWTGIILVAMGGAALGQDKL